MTHNSNSPFDDVTGQIRGIEGENRARIEAAQAEPKLEARHIPASTETAPQDLNLSPESLMGSDFDSIKAGLRERAELYYTSRSEVFKQNNPNATPAQLDLANEEIFNILNAGVNDPSNFGKFALATRGRQFKQNIGEQTRRVAAQKVNTVEADRGEDLVAIDSDPNLLPETLKNRNSLYEEAARGAGISNKTIAAEIKNPKSKSKAKKHK